MELGILALRGFSDMTEKGRDLMVRDKFIASQRSCDLRRHLDGAAPETSILDSCRVWESHGEPEDIEDRSQNLSCRQQILPISARTISKSKSGVGSLGPATIGLPRRADHSMADRELLMRTVLEVVRECWETDMNDEGDRKKTLMDPVGPRMRRVMSTGGEEVRKLSAGRPLSAEAVEFSPAPAREQHRRQGRRTMPIGTSGINPTQVAELPLSKVGGGGQ